MGFSDIGNEIDLDSEEFHEMVQNYMCMGAILADLITSVKGDQPGFIFEDGEIRIIIERIDDE